jgi:hypothetical protein
MATIESIAKPVQFRAKSVLLYFEAQSIVKQIFKKTKQI